MNKIILSFPTAIELSNLNAYCTVQEYNEEPMENYHDVFFSHTNILKIVRSFETSSQQTPCDNSCHSSDIFQQRTVPKRMRAATCYRSRFSRAHALGERSGTYLNGIEYRENIFANSCTPEHQGRSIYNSSIFRRPD